MILFNSAMQKEKIAAIGLAIIVVGSLSTYLLVTYGEDILSNLFPEEKAGELEANINEGDCVDLHYIGRYASNDTIFSSSYEDPNSRTGGTPLKVFVSFNATDTPPDEYRDYVPSPLMIQSIEQYFELALSPVSVKEGFMDVLITMNEGDNFRKTTSNLTYDKAFGWSPRIGDVLNFTLLSPLLLEYEIIDIQPDADMPADVAELYGEYFGNKTTLFTLRDITHYTGEILEDKYPSWENSTVVTKINQTLLWMYTTPTYDIGENFTWTDFNSETGVQLVYPEDASSITNITDGTIEITHSPDKNTTIEESIYYASYGMFFPSATYTVENVTADKINTNYTDPSTGNISHKEFDRTIVIQRNETLNITEDIPGEILEIQLMFLRHLVDDFVVSYNVLSDETVYFEIEIVKVYKTSQEES